MKKLSLAPLLIKLILLLPVAVFSIFLGYFAVDVPQGDDFELILHFLSNYVSAGNDYAQKGSLLTAQFVEHRLFYTRIVALLHYLLAGQVSFYLIILIGNLSLLGIFIVCWRQLKIAGYSLFYLLPVSLILFQPCYSYDGVLWPAATLAYNSVSFFAILTIHWLSGRRKLHFGLAILCAALCTYTFGNGILILLVGAGLLIVQKRWKDLLIWILIAAFITFIYFTGYEKFESRNNPLDHLTNHTIYTFINSLVFLGSALNWNETWPKSLDYNDIPSIIAGSIVLITYVHLLFQTCQSWLSSKKADDQSNSRRHVDFLIGSFSFFVLTGVLLCVSRVDKDQILMHINRYRIHSVVGLLLAYFRILPLLKAKSSFYSLAVISIAGCWILSFFHFYSIFSEFNRVYTAGQHNWVTTHQWFIYRDTSYWEEASKMVMNKADTTINYRIIQSPFTKVDAKEEIVNDFKVERSEADKVLKITGSAPNLGFFGKREDYYIAFKNLSQSITYVIPATYDRRSVKLVVMGQNYYYPHFYSHLTYRHFPTGQYQIGIAQSKDRKLEIKWQPITFDAVQESNLTH